MDKKGIVNGVSDEDTFNLLTEYKQWIKVPVYGIDCPESEQDYVNMLFFNILIELSIHKLLVIKELKT